MRYSLSVTTRDGCVLVFTSNFVPQVHRMVVEEGRLATVIHPDVSFSRRAPLPYPSYYLMIFCRLQYVSLIFSVSINVSTCNSKQLAQRTERDDDEGVKKNEEAHEYQRI